ncbi:MAG: ABC transporter ATP-binding protein [Planctomycetes bacterium]|nr:ABC transporter ATP-binding protein [Planctomycetota bacterium]
MIQLENVSKVYESLGGPVRALDELSLSIDAGEFVAVRGPSGCGKSTLLTIVGGLNRPSSGRVVVDGRDLGAMSGEELSQFRARAIGFVFQLFHLLPYLNVLDNVLVAAGTNGQGQAEAKATELLDQFGMSDRLTHHPAQLSAGERQRTAMARAMLHQPKLILADEPTGNLDPESADAVLDHLQAYQQSGGTVLLVTHDDRAAARASRTIPLRAGQLDAEALRGEASPRD